MDVEKLMENEEFLAKLKETQNAAEAAALLNSYGVEITESELEAYIAAQEEGELSEEALETVAGGGKFGSTLRRLVRFIRDINGPIKGPVWTWGK